MMKFSVRSDEEFYNKIVSLEMDIRSISGVFQNTGITADVDDLDEWVDAVNELKEKIEIISIEGYKRFVEKNTEKD